ncbi:hypothetical protein CS915_002265 [Enterococcus faecium]|nr:hypothetical protein CS915_002265 [Enterococcus faecium]
MCSTYGEAQRFYHSTVDFLNKRLKLEISPEKSMCKKADCVDFVCLPSLDGDIRFCRCRENKRINAIRESKF